MKKLLVPALILLALLCAPFTRQDISELLPVQTLSLSRSGGVYCLQTDSGYYGRGGTLARALADLHRCAPGVVELATARQLVVEQACVTALPELIRLQVLRPATQVYVSPRAVSAPDAGDLFSRHSSAVTLSRVQAGLLRGEPAVLPELRGAEGRYWLAA